uniref:Uncharacterized protein n=1 Tax=Kwoniella bestiolae CBS 10118 TaxID=1296100 RepID=A0A1B9FSG0_9TREE|nr:hypothetical protein I302_08479 [Kwoniella bestiolae CBS 10118]OCF21702.1 hypothetical protein I302_08479 [Kwoniella bestiolae CBS 10118]
MSLEKAALDIWKFPCPEGGKARSHKVISIFAISRDFTIRVNWAIVLSSETKKNVLESAHIKCLPCGPSPDEWRDSVVASLEERDIVFTKDSEDGTDIIRCSFADAPSTDRRIVSIDDTPSGMTTEGVVRYPFGQGVADRDDDHEIFEIEKNIGPPSTVIGALLAD